MAKTEITRADIIPVDEYAKTRKERRAAVTLMKRDRRVACGPDATFYFENFATMWHQVHEMLYIEKGGEDQIADELAAYNPLIPNGRELVATLMFEVDDDDRRRVFLAGLGGVEETITLEFDDQTIKGMPEDDVDRTTAGREGLIRAVYSFSVLGRTGGKIQDDRRSRGPRHRACKIRAHGGLGGCDA